MKNLNVAARLRNLDILFLAVNLLNTIVVNAG